MICLASIRAVAVLLTLISSLPVQARAETAGRLPTSFWWYYNADPKGWRYWSRLYDETWIEKYDRVESRFTISGAAPVEGCNGIQMAKDDKTIEVFIPDSTCVGQELLFRFASAGASSRWRLLGVLQQIRYKSNLAGPSLAPSSASSDPAADLDNSIMAMLDKDPPKEKIAYATFRIKFFAMIDARLEHCGVSTNFLNRAISVSRQCTSSDQAANAIELFSTTKRILQRYYNITMDNDCNGPSASERNALGQKMEDEISPKDRANLRVARHREIRITTDREPSDWPSLAR